MGVYPDAKRGLFGGDMKDDNTYVMVTVSNRGSAPTTITHMVLFEYPSELAIYIPQRLRRWKWVHRQLGEARVFIANSGAAGQMPYLLQPGTYWIGLAKHTPDLERAIETGRLYVGIRGSHSDKTSFKRVKRQRDFPTPGMFRATLLP